MGNLVIVERKRKRFNPYRVLVRTIYTAIALPMLAFAVFSMYWVAIFPDMEKSGAEFPWWDIPVFMIGSVLWMAAIVATVVGLYYAVRGIIRGINWLNAKADEYGKVSD